MTNLTMGQKYYSYIHVLATIGVALFFFCVINKMNKGTQQRQVMMASEHRMGKEKESSSVESVRMTAEQSSAAIVALIYGDTSLNELCLSIRTLQNIQGSLSAPVHVFHLDDLEDNVRLENQNYLLSCTDRDVYANVIDTSFPVGFVPEEGKDYTSSHINRFWTTQIWEHPAMGSYEIIMRIDHDVCFSLPNNDLPGLKSPYQVYSSHHFPGTVGANTGNLNEMYEFSHDYIVEHELVVGHVNLWQIIDDTHMEVDSLPNFIDSFEVVRKSFMLRSDVHDWHYALTDMPPYGYFSRGWTSDAERFMTMAIFGTPSIVDDSIVPGFMQKNLVGGVTHDKACTLPFVE